MAPVIVPGDVLRYYPDAANPEHCYTAVVSKNGNVYEIDKMSIHDGRHTVFKNVQMWLYSLPNEPTLHHVMVNRRLAHRVYDMLPPPVLPPEEREERGYVERSNDMGRFAPGDIIAYKERYDDRYFKAVVMKDMMACEIDSPCHEIAECAIYDSINHYVDCVSRSVHIDNWSVNDPRIEEDYSAEFEVQEIQMRNARRV